MNCLFFIAFYNLQYIPFFRLFPAQKPSGTDWHCSPLPCKYFSLFSCLFISSEEHVKTPHLDPRSPAALLLAWSPAGFFNNTLTAFRKSNVEWLHVFFIVLLHVFSPCGRICFPHVQFTGHKQATGVWCWASLCTVSCSLSLWGKNKQPSNELFTMKSRGQSSETRWHRAFRSTLLICDWSAELYPSTEFRRKVRMTSKCD